MTSVPLLSSRSTSTSSYGASAAAPRPVSPTRTKTKEELKASLVHLLVNVGVSTVEDWNVKKTALEAEVKILREDNEELKKTASVVEMLRKQITDLEDEIKARDESLTNSPLSPRKAKKTNSMDNLQIEQSDLSKPNLDTLQSLTATMKEIRTKINESIANIKENQEALKNALSGEGKSDLFIFYRDNLVENRKKFFESKAFVYLVILAKAIKALKNDSNKSISDYIGGTCVSYFEKFRWSFNDLVNNIRQSKKLLGQLLLADQKEKAASNNGVIEDPRARKPGTVWGTYVKELTTNDEIFFTDFDRYFPSFTSLDEVLKYKVEFKDDDPMLSTSEYLAQTAPVKAVNNPSSPSTAPATITQEDIKPLGESLTMPIELALLSTSLTRLTPNNPTNTPASTSTTL